jgi:DNA repair protein RecN (Recombination protein N)
VIDEIRITGLGVIDEAQVRPGPGFTALTGETGAGKTIVLTALGLLLGGKVAVSLVRGERALVEGRWRLPGAAVASRRVVEIGGDLDDGDLIITRSVPREGRSRASLGGVSVPVATLTQLADELVAVHGQTDQLRLRRAGPQRLQLDAFAGLPLAAELGEYRKSFRQLGSLVAEREEREGDARARAAEADLLEYGLAEIAALNPQPGEDELLAAEDERLGNVESLTEACLRAQSAISDADGEGADALARLGEAVRALEQAGVHDPTLAELAQRVQEAAALVADVSADIASYTASLEVDPRRLEWVQERRSALSRLSRKYGATTDGVLAWAARSSVRLADLGDDSSRIEFLRAEEGRARIELGRCAGRLSRLRAEAASNLASAVTAELAALAMPDATFEVSVSSRDDPDGLDVDGRRVGYGPDGADDVSFLLAPHRGATPAPIGQGASGGELSRVMLALEVAVAGTAPAPTMVFDEVDAGVGGKAAVEVGRRLLRLSRHTQVIVVTHLPQVAAFADSQIVVAKGDDGRITSSSVELVTGRPGGGRSLGCWRAKMPPPTPSRMQTSSSLWAPPRFRGSRLLPW